MESGERKRGVVRGGGEVRGGRRREDVGVGEGMWGVGERRC